MTRMSTIYSRLSYGTGTTLTGCGVSAKAYAETAQQRARTVLVYGPFAVALRWLMASQ
ncbi:hypothetical protein MKJ05_07645 [Citrobacter braakii]|nr:hypothetical protein MKJ05_07645 [Citrobacter braakii]